MLGTFSKYAVNNSVFNRLGAAHEIITFCINRDLFNGLTGMFGKNRVQTAAQFQDFLSLDFDIRSSTVRTAGRW